MIAPPKAILLELTHRCPLQCPYCSNPTQLLKKKEELPAEDWIRVIKEAAQIPIQQLHFSGGEPLLYPDLMLLLKTASDRGLYVNLITSGINLSKETAADLKKAGVKHVQLSIQGPNSDYNLILSGYHKAFEHKARAAQAILSENLALTINWVMCQQNIEALSEVIERVLEWGAHRLELAMTQYHGWAFVNRDALHPTSEQITQAEQIIYDAKKKLRGKLVIDYVPSDYRLGFPKPCMDGWGQKLLVINPQGYALPCHMAKSLPMDFERITDRPLMDIWTDSTSFNQYRGTDWMPEPCQSCSKKTLDWGGCRCQAFALTGNAGLTDPACQYSPDHALIKQSNTNATSIQPLVFRKCGKIKQT